MQKRNLTMRFSEYIAVSGACMTLRGQYGRLMHSAACGRDEWKGWARASRVFAVLDKKPGCG